MLWAEANDPTFVSSRVAAEATVLKYMVVVLVMMVILLVVILLDTKG
jgi:hypothetical protein